jgi:NAD(P)-dependent dehydrogenase (short-subunit alcohol dehydrogenase family)
VGATRFHFEGQVAVVTGGCHGIGRGALDAFAAAGAHVCLLDVDEVAGQAAIEEIKARGGEATFYRCDVTNPTEVDETFRSVVADSGRIDTLVLSVGGFFNKIGMEDTSDEEWDRILALNLTSAFRCTRAVAPVLKRQGSGSLVYIGSAAGLTGIAGVTLSPAYSAAKAGVHSLARQAALELAPFGITANAVAPGTTSTERVDRLHGQQTMQKIGEAIPLGRVGQVSDIVGAVLFLASPEGGYITGQTLSVNGGWLMV